MKTIETVLAQHSFFKDLTPKQIKVIAGCASHASFKMNEKIFSEGQRADKFYVIIHGKVAVEMAAAQRGTITIQTIRDGDVLGWSWLISPYRWRFSARAIELTHAIALDARCLRGKCEKDNKLAYELLKRFSQMLATRLEMTRIQLLDVYGVH